MDKGIHLLLFNVRAENGASGYSRQIKIGHKKFRQDLLDLQSFLRKFWVKGDTDLNTFRFGTIDKELTE